MLKLFLWNESSVVEVRYIIIVPITIILLFLRPTVSDAYHRITETTIGTMKWASPTNDFVAFATTVVVAIKVLISLIVITSLVDTDPGVEAMMPLSPQQQQQQQQQRHRTRLWSPSSAYQCIPTTPRQSIRILATKQTTRTHQRTSISTTKKVTATATATADIGVATIAALSGTKIKTTTTTKDNNGNGGTEIQKHVHYYDYDDDWIALGRCVRNIVRSAACHSIQERGRFCVAIDGCFTLTERIGNGGTENKNATMTMSDMLEGTSDRGGSYWTSKTTLIHARHPCCDKAAFSAAVTKHNSDGNSQSPGIGKKRCEDDNSKHSTMVHTNQEATLQLLRDEWVGTKATLPSIIHTRDAVAVVQAADYVKKLRSIPTKILPRMSNSGRAATDIPVLDLILLMIKDDEDKNGIRHYLTTTENEGEDKAEHKNNKRKGRRKKKKKKKHVPWVVPVGNDSTNKEGNLSSSTSVTLTLSLPVLNAAKRVLVVVAETETASENDKSRSTIRNWKSSLQQAIPKATWIFVRDSSSVKKTAKLGRQSSCTTTSTDTNIGSTFFASPSLTNSYLDSLTASSNLL